MNKQMVILEFNSFFSRTSNRVCVISGPRTISENDLLSFYKESTLWTYILQVPRVDQLHEFDTSSPIDLFPQIWPG